MTRKLIFCTLFISTLAIGEGLCQFSAGPKIGGTFDRPFHDNKEPLSDANISPKFSFGYNVGGVLIYQLTDRFAFHTEILYAKRRKKLEGGILDIFNHEATYRNIEVPVLFAYTFKKKYYTGFVNFGANLSYWLSGKGEIFSFEHDEVGIPSYEYEVVFGAMPDGDDSGNLFLEEPNRVQVGMEIGVGAFINTTSPKNRILVQLKFQRGHSWLGRDTELDVGLDEYTESFRFSNNTLSLSVGYLFSFDFGQGRQGKSTSEVTKKKRKK